MSEVGVPPKNSGTWLNNTGVALQKAKYIERRGLKKDRLARQLVKRFYPDKDFNELSKEQQNDLRARADRIMEGGKRRTRHRRRKTRSKRLHTRRARL